MLHHNTKGSIITNYIRLSTSRNVHELAMRLKVSILSAKRCLAMNKNNIFCRSIIKIFMPQARTHQHLKTHFQTLIVSTKAYSRYQKQS